MWLWNMISTLEAYATWKLRVHWVFSYPSLQSLIATTSFIKKTQHLDPCHLEHTTLKLLCGKVFSIIMKIKSPQNFSKIFIMRQSLNRCHNKNIKKKWWYMWGAHLVLEAVAGEASRACRWRPTAGLWWERRIYSDALSWRECHPHWIGGTALRSTRPRGRTGRARRRSCPQTHAPWCPIGPCAGSPGSPHVAIFRGGARISCVPHYKLKRASFLHCRPLAVLFLRHFTYIYARFFVFVGWGCCG